jgi:hypothetical protein
VGSRSLRLAGRTGEVAEGHPYRMLTLWQRDHICRLAPLVLHFDERAHVFFPPYPFRTARRFRPGVTLATSPLPVG